MSAKNRVISLFMITISQKNLNVEEFRHQLAAQIVANAIFTKTKTYLNLKYSHNLRHL